VKLRMGWLVGCDGTAHHRTAAAWERCRKWSGSLAGGPQPGGNQGSLLDRLRRRGPGAGDCRGTRAVQVSTRRTDSSPHAAPLHWGDNPVLSPLWTRRDALQWRTAQPLVPSSHAGCGPETHGVWRIRSTRFSDGAPVHLETRRHDVAWAAWSSDTWVVLLATGGAWFQVPHGLGFRLMNPPIRAWCCWPPAAPGSRCFQCSPRTLKPSSSRAAPANLPFPEPDPRAQDRLQAYQIGAAAVVKQPSFQLPGCI
jgi:hypothetical protein